MVLLEGASEAHLEKDDTKVVRGKIVTRISKCARPRSDGSGVGDFPSEGDARSSGVANDARKVQNDVAMRGITSQKRSSRLHRNLWEELGR